MKEYLVSHPEVLQEAIAELEKRQADAEVVKHREGVKQHTQALFYSPRQVTIGNRQGAPGFFVDAEFGAYLDNLKLTANQ